MNRTHRVVNKEWLLELGRALISKYLLRKFIKVAESKQKSQSMITDKLGAWSVKNRHKNANMDCKCGPF